MIDCIVAVDSKFGIGKNGNLLFKIPEDMKHFKKVTEGGCVVMGRKTFESLPNGIPLKDRENIVITSSVKIPEVKHISVNLNKDLQESLSYTVCNMEYMKTWLAEKSTIMLNNGIHIIGGGQTYKELLPFCERLYLTMCYDSHEEADTFFPNVNDMEEWELTEQTEILVSENGMHYQIFTYDRKDYEITSTLSADDTKDIVNEDIVVTVKSALGTDCTVILSPKDGNMNIFSNWDALMTSPKFAEKFMKRFVYLGGR